MCFDQFLFSISMLYSGAAWAKRRYTTLVRVIDYLILLIYMFLTCCYACGKLCNIRLVDSKDEHLANVLYLLAVGFVQVTVK